MKRSLLTAFCSFSLMLCFAQMGEGSKQVYSSPKLKEAVAAHKNVAILPFKATISYKKVPKDFNAEANKAEEQNLALQMQSGMYTYLLKKAKNFSVTFQDVDRTNALLRQAGVFDNVDLLTQDSICKILKVDAAIKCTYSYERTSTEGGAMVKGLLFGSGAANTGTGSLVMQLYDGADGELLWRFYKSMNENLAGGANQVMERMMRKVARNFPYEK
ncbi:MAG: hypothetical protein KF781_02860 [Chitinophagaceae bacterium]|nr:hypothetical protein [Chitinophagaceae bacterium]MCW5904451.1 hypothetical protein [Chitinophagaceae bacterium]